MKKTKIILILIITFLTNINTKALVANIIYQPGIYSNKMQGNRTYYGQLGYVYIDDKIAYCLEPYKIIGTDYIIDSSIMNNFTQDDLNYFTLLSYYGYNNTNHNNVYYYMATQELIWRRITGQEVYWTTQNATKGERINIESYKNEILDSINTHNISASFGNATVKGKFRETIVLEDVNNVLKYYQINNQTPNKVRKEGNKLYITIMSSKSENILLDRKFNNGTGNVFYSAVNSQALGTFALNQTKRLTLHVQATNKYSMKLNVTFKDKNTKKTIKDKVKFKIKDLDKDEYIKNNMIFETDENGNYLSDFYVEEGNYQVEIVEVPPNYIVEEGTKFQIIEDPNVEIINVDNYIEEAKGQIEITRIFDMTELGKEKLKVSDANYEIYTKESIYNTDGNILYKKDDLIETIKTDSNGQAISNKLPLGNYYIKENLEDDIITKDNNIYDVELKYKDQNTKIIVEKIEIITKPDTFDWNLDIEEHKTKCIDDECNTIIKKIDEVEYGIYADKDIIIDGKTIINKDDLIIKTATDYNGLIKEEVPLLEGKYEVRELTDMSIYPEKFENITFNFNEEKELNTKVIKTLREEEKGINELPKTFNKYFKYYLFCIFSFVISFGLIVYGIKKD